MTKAIVRQEQGVAVVDLSGRITLGDGTGEIRETMKKLIQSGQKKILLNLGDVTYMDSAGLGELVGAYASVANAGGVIKLLNAQKKVSDLLSVTKLYTVFQAFNNEPEAIRSFA
jgi:anti-sigma B factor antagonist